MSLWKRANNANSAPKFTVESVKGTSGTTAYGNSTVNAFVTNQKVGVELEDNNWVLNRKGTGGVSLTISDGGVGYSNSTWIRVSGGAVNATANVITNANGVITSLNVTNAGSGFSNTSTVSIQTPGSGNSAVIVATLTGRAGRVQKEILVA